MPSLFSLVATILTVDDYEPARYAHARLLRQAGFRVYEAADGRGAIEIAQRERPDVVLLDVHLPDLHGFEVCEQLKSHRATRDIPIVHISNTARGDRFRRESIAAGAALFLHEPVAGAELVRLLRDVIAKARTFTTGAPPAERTSHGRPPRARPARTAGKPGPAIGARRRAGSRSRRPAAASKKR